MNEEKKTQNNPEIPEIFLRPYDPKEHEDSLYAMWEDSGFFNPDVCIEKGVTEPDAEPFSIVLPPPNVTGTLHMGHASMLAIEDIMVRYNRMQGKRTLWIPGTDSAAIATQSKVEGIIYKEEKKNRHDLGREELLKRVNAFAEESKNTIINQTKKMGSSLDWSRYAFTLDEKRNFAVSTAFKKMFDAGLIYRGARIVNWDPKGQTTISDDEIVHEERQSKLYTFRYAPDFPITISTTRPETKVGDTAVAVHPNDPRYKEFIGKEYDIIFCDVPIHIKVVADEAAEMEFGTGALGVTPAHSQIDWEIADRHNLPRPQVINEYAKMTVDGRLNGMKVGEARETVVAWLREQNLLQKEEDITQNVATAERTGGIIEPLPKLQWFIAVNKEFTMGHSEIPGVAEGDTVTLKLLMEKAVEHADGISIFPEHFSKTYYHWIKNLRDWCISRQIWYGHRIPAEYCIHDLENSEGTFGFMTDRRGQTGINGLCVFTSEMKQCLLDNSVSDELISVGNWDVPYIENLNFRQASILIKNDFITFQQILDYEPYISRLDRCNKLHIFNSHEERVLDSVQDPDTLDTWFSSGLWTFSTLGWPETTPDFKTYHPTAILETGYDILFFWVARMVLMSTFNTGQLPFKKVYLHGLVRDAKGRKMSKSLGNIIDPLEMITKYGADATRLSLVVGAAPGNDIPLSEDRVRGYKHFANKLWNITRFVLSNVNDIDLKANLTELDKSLFFNGELDVHVEDITKHIENYRIDMAAGVLYQYTWRFFADEFIERSKAVLENGTEEEKASRRRILVERLIVQLKLLHPFMPFVTEAIWQNIPKELRRNEPDILMVAKWPKV